MNINKSAVGICMGASTISIVKVSEKENKIIIDSVLSFNHEGRPLDFLKNNLKRFEGLSAAVTGRKFRTNIDLPQLTEAEAIELAISEVIEPDINIEAVVSAGSETFIIYELDKKRHIKGILTGSKCASGTGEFFLQQLRRMDITPEEAVEEALKSEPYNISGRCSVFCKSDCTHALNKGEPIGTITAGLCDMMAQKVIELMPRIPKKNIICVGGVTKNNAVVDILSRNIDNLIIPSQSSYFEAYGAALWALGKSTKPINKDIFKEKKSSFTFLPPIYKFRDKVIFKESETKKAVKNDVCIIGLDVGSTTTKAVLMRKSDNAVLASCYLRTNGDPVGASRKCFEEINSSIKLPVIIEGLGVTGSGRYISALYAGTDAVINEIIAHAEAAVYFDKDVDTIFEIGGQDAKYTYLVNGVPCDYAMNEACSAGTGSFLEESARESLGIDTKEIGDIALKSNNPPNFSDQCAAFISSDIKNAIQEGVGVNDIIAGLVYSICMNYNNKVRGPRTAGKKIFMQGGVCYNKAVPAAMAALTGSSIIVPPEPGLMGAFGVALEVKKRQAMGFLKIHNFDLNELIRREVQYGKSFTCAGGKEKCDRKCSIQTVIVNGEKMPFGGACNKYYNLKGDKCENSVNLVKTRQEMLFGEEFNEFITDTNAPTVGINRSFLNYLLYPLFNNFFTKLGFKTIMPDIALAEGIARKGASFCHPYEIAHGYYLRLLQMKPDYVMLPHIRELYVPNAHSRKHDMQSTCQLVQSETYCFKEAFAEEEKNTQVIRPIFNFSKGYEKDKKEFRKLAASLGVKGKIFSSAFENAIAKQEHFNSEIKNMGKYFLKELEKNPDMMAVVVFGRPYNALTSDLNMGIPEKFSSRGIPVIPFDMLPADDEPVNSQMHWATGQLLLRAAKFVEKHPQLYGVWITNFSCGPDSFLQRFFRDIMGRKPSLTLELDSHTADAGVTTRVEAFLDIIDRYRKVSEEKEHSENTQPLKTVLDGKIMKLQLPNGKLIPLTDERVTIVLPSMGWLLTQAAGAAFQNSGYNVHVIPEPDPGVLKLGRANTSCKECLPLILIAGMLEKYLADNPPGENEYILFFVPKSEGGCRLGQYTVYLENHLASKNIKNVVLLSLDGENNYAGVSQKTLINIMSASTVADIMDDVYNAILALASDPKEGREIFMDEWNKLLATIRSGANLEVALKDTAEVLRKIKLHTSYKDACKVMLCGEIYVRKERFTSDPVIKSLAQKGIVVKTATFNEWMFYVDYMVSAGVLEAGLTPLGMIMHNIKHLYKKSIDDKFRHIMAKSLLIDSEGIDIKSIMNYGKQFMSYYLGGDPILSCGSSMKEIFSHVSGIVLIGPFACMQSRVSEAIMNETLTVGRKQEIEKGKAVIPENIGGVPFLAIETDGNVLPQILDAKIETFAVQAVRVNEEMKKSCLACH